MCVCIPLRQSGNIVLARARAAVRVFDRGARTDVVSTRGAGAHIDAIAGLEGLKASRTRLWMQRRRRQQKPRDGDYPCAAFARCAHLSLSLSLCLCPSAQKESAVCRVVCANFDSVWRVVFRSSKPDFSDNNGLFLPFVLAYTYTFFSVIYIVPLIWPKPSECTSQQQRRCQSFDHCFAQ